MGLLKLNPGDQSKENKNGLYLLVTSVPVVELGAGVDPVKNIGMAPDPISQSIVDMYVCILYNVQMEIQLLLRKRTGAKKSQY